MAAVVPQNLSDLHGRTGHYDYHRASHDVSGHSVGWNDWVVIVIFCGLIGYDFYQAATDEPTVDNAIWYACENYLDLINIFLRVLNITGRSRD